MNVTNPIDPGVLFGGTWKRIPFRYPVGVGTIENNNNDVFGSVKDYVDNKWSINAGELVGEIQHRLSIEEMPSHNHIVYRGSQGNSYFGLTGKEPSGDTPYGVGTTYAGGNWAHNNIPPSIAVYMWQRIA